MVDPVRIAVGLFLIVVGGLSMINHPVVGANRRLTALGTTRSPSEIEMNEYAILLGQHLGAVFVIVGTLVVLDAAT